MSWVRAVSRRRMGPWMQGPTGAVHPDTVELCIAESGSIGVDTDGQRGRMTAGQASLIPAGVPHGCWTEGDAFVEIVVHLDAGVVAARVGAVAPGIRTLAEHEEAHVRALRRAAEGRGDAGEAALALVRGFVHAGAPVSDERLRRVVDAVRADLRRRWTVEDLASVAAMSPAHFSRTFREVLGAAPARWVSDQRLERARWLMRTTDRSLSEIARDVGLSSSSRLTEGFQRRWGTSPSAWRKEEGR